MLSHPSHRTATRYHPSGSARGDLAQAKSRRRDLPAGQPVSHSRYSASSCWLHPSPPRCAVPRHRRAETPRISRSCRRLRHRGGRVSIMFLTSHVDECTSTPQTRPPDVVRLASDVRRQQRIGRRQGCLFASMDRRKPTAEWVAPCEPWSLIMAGYALAGRRVIGFLVDLHIQQYGTALRTTANVAGGNEAPVRRR
jgi:hypothetical protein